MSEEPMNPKYPRASNAGVILDLLIFNWNLSPLRLLPNRDGADGSITFPTLNVTSDFDINGSVFSQKLKGTGIFSANLSKFSTISFDWFIIILVAFVNSPQGLALL